MIKVEYINSLNYKEESDPHQTKIDKSNYDRLCLF